MLSSPRNVLLVVTVLFALGVSPAFADTIVLLDGKSLSGTIEDPAADPVYIKIPNGRVGFYHHEISEMIYNDEEIDFRGAKTGQMAEEEEDEAGILPTLEDLPKPENDTERDRQYEALITALSQVVRHPEEADEADLDKVPAYVEAFGKLGPEVVPMLETSLKSASTRELPYLVEALNHADPARGQALATDLVTAGITPAAREAAVRILGQGELSATRGTLATVLRDETATTVRAAAVDALAANEAREANELLVDALDDQSAVVQRMAKRALEEKTGKSFDDNAAWRKWVETQTP